LAAAIGVRSLKIIPGEKETIWTYNHFTIWILTSAFSFSIMFLIIWIPLAIIEKFEGDFIVVNGITHITVDCLSQFVAIPLIAFGVGLLQYLILRRSLAPMGWWI
jgi:hypothetical protein